MMAGLRVKTQQKVDLGFESVVMSQRVNNKMFGFFVYSIALKSYHEKVSKKLPILPGE